MPMVKPTGDPVAVSPMLKPVEAVPPVVKPVTAAPPVMVKPVEAVTAAPPPMVKPVVRAASSPSDPAPVAPGRAASSGEPEAALPRVDMGSLRNISAEDLQRSKLSLDDLQFLASLPSDDPGFGAVLDKRLGDALGKARRDARREVRGEVEESVREAAEKLEKEYEEKLAAALERVRGEEAVKARAELGASMASRPPEAPGLDAPGSGEGDSEGRGRDLSQVQRGFIS